MLRKFGVTKSQEILLLIGIILIIANEAGPHISLVNFQACLTRDRWVHFVFLEISFIKLNCIKVFIDKLKKKQKIVDIHRGFITHATILPRILPVRQYLRFGGPIIQVLLLDYIMCTTSIID